MTTIFLVIALICFIAAAFGMSTGKINLVALGLAFMAGAQLIPLAGL